MANNIAVAVTADIADLTAKMAVAKVTMQDVGKTMREVARDVAAGDTTAATKTRLLEVSDAYSQASNQAALYARQMRGTQVAANDVAVSSGQQKFAMRDLAYQMQDLGVGFSMAAQSSEPFKMAMMTITQQSSQVLSAIQLMRNEAGGFIGFLGGPWGAAIMAAASVIANLAVAHFSAGKAADDQKDSEVDLSKALEILHDKTVQATASIEDGIRASLGDAMAKRQQAADTLKAAEAEIALARAKSSRIDQDLRNGPQGANNPVIQAQAAAGEEAKARDLQVQIDKLRANINTGTEAVRGFQAEIARIVIDRQFDKGAAATARYSQQVSDLAKSYREGKISLDEYTRSVYQAREAEKQAQDDAKPHRQAHGGGKPKDDTKEREREAARVAKEAARTAEQAAREELQERLSVNRQEEAMAEEKVRAEIALSHVALQSKIEDINAEQRAGRTSGTQAIQQRAQVNRQIEALDQNLEQRLIQAKLKELRDNQKNYAAGTREFRDYTRQIEMLELQHLNRMALLKQQGNVRQRQADQQLQTESNRQMNGMASTWAQNLSRMATLQQGFSATVQGMWQGIANVVSGVIEQMLEKWIISQLVKIGLIKAEHSTTVASQASLAGAGGVASMAAAPFPINLTAPAFGASMSAAALSFGMAGFAKGTNELPTDMVAQIHAGERIVPKADNDTLIELTKRGAGIGGPSGPAGGRSGRSGSSDGGVHIHMHGTVIQGTRDLKRWAEANASQLSGAGKKYARNGGR